MVLQGKPEEEKKWSVPSGGRNPDESYEECCIREVLEETGYEVRIKEKLMIKNQVVHYFNVEIIGGKETIQDPDGLIFEIGWKSIEEIRNLKPHPTPRTGVGRREYEKRYLKDWPQIHFENRSFVPSIGLETTKTKINNAILTGRFVGFQLPICGAIIAIRKLELK